MTDLRLCLFHGNSSLIDSKHFGRKQVFRERGGVARIQTGVEVQELCFVVVVANKTNDKLQKVDPFIKFNLFLKGESRYSQLLGGIRPKG